MRFSLVLFDLGSTLLYFQGNWDQVIIEAIDLMSTQVKRMGYPILPADLAKKYSAVLQQYYIERDRDNIEYSTEKLLDDLLADTYDIHLTKDQLYSALDTFYDHTGKHWKLDEETIPLLKSLTEQGYQLGLITNASYPRDVANLLEKNNLTPYFQQVLISAEVGYRKPHEAIFQKALSFFNVEPYQAIMIGDTLNADILGSRHMGMKNIWVARWASAPSTHYRDDMIVPDRTVQRLSQIPDLLNNWE